MSEIGIFVSSTGNFNIIALDHMNKLKNIAFVGNSEHFDNEINLAGSEGLKGTKVDDIELQKFFSSSPFVTVRPWALGLASLPDFPDFPDFAECRVPSA